MPVKKVGNKYAIGSSEALYGAKPAATKAYQAYLAKKKGKK